MMLQQCQRNSRLNVKAAEAAIAVPLAQDHSLSLAQESFTRMERAQSVYSARPRERASTSGEVIYLTTACVWGALAIGQMISGDLTAGTMSIIASGVFALLAKSEELLNAYRQSQVKQTTAEPPVSKKKCSASVRSW